MAAQRRRPKAWPLALLALGVLLLAFLVWLGVDYWTRTRPAPGWQDPVLQTRPDQVEPGLALLALAGWPREQVVDLALSQEAWETAYAILVHSPEIPDRERAGLWLLLGRTFAEAGQSERAVLCYRQAEAIAVLSSVLSDYVRADALSQAALGAAQAGQASLARRWAEETRVLVEGPTDLQPVLRQQLADRLREVYRLLGEAPPTVAIAAARPLPAGGVGEPILPTLIQPVDLPEAVMQARKAREAAARRAAQWVAQGGSEEDWQPALARALQQENEAVERALGSLAQDEIRLNVLAGIMQQRVMWLSTKYQVARRGFGTSIVPEWEEQAANIRSELARAYQELFSIHHDQVVALPTAAQVSQGWVEVLRKEAKAGFLGLYPNYPERQVAEDLARRMDEWLLTRPEVAWRIAVVERDGGVDYILVGR